MSLECGLGTSPSQHRALHTPITVGKQIGIFKRPHYPAAWGLDLD